MNVLIVENEKPAADKLLRMLKSIDITMTVPAILETVEGTVNWIHGNNPPDLILMDVLLDDGLCFEIFDTIKLEVPVIFITAYDEYSIRAFKVNSVDYLLKPVEENLLRAALVKFNKYHLSSKYEKSKIDNIVREFTPHYKSRFLVKMGSRYRSVPVQDINYFHITERNVFLMDSSGKDYGMDYSLDQLMKLLNPDKFYRINRDCIINMDSILLIESYSSSRLQVKLKNEKGTGLFVVSRDKTADFKNWIDT
ncbi:MAG TPA: LytTR family DNA-binding domain-containing protein [Bacteroidales bacterium]|nr:LytTR family DNA-binding domain-containing protein [Bacteroidales bacterium]